MGGLRMADAVSPMHAHVMDMLFCREQEQQEADAYQSDPCAEKGRHREPLYGPEMLETWLLLEFCDRCAGAPPLGVKEVPNDSLSVSDDCERGARVCLTQRPVPNTCQRAEQTLPSRLA